MLQKDTTPCQLTIILKWGRQKKQEIKKRRISVPFCNFILYVKKVGLDGKLHPLYFVIHNKSVMLVAMLIILCIYHYSKVLEVRKHNVTANKFKGPKLIGGYPMLCMIYLYIQMMIQCFALNDCTVLEIDRLIRIGKWVKNFTLGPQDVKEIFMGMWGSGRVGPRCNNQGGMAPKQSGCSEGPDVAVVVCHFFLGKLLFATWLYQDGAIRSLLLSQSISFFIIFSQLSFDRYFV